MGLSATDVMPTIKLMNLLAFMHSSSVRAWLVTIARPQDLKVLPKGCSVVSP